MKASIRTFPRLTTAALYDLPQGASFLVTDDKHFYQVVDQGYFDLTETYSNDDGKFVIKPIPRAVFSPKSTRV